MTVLRCCPRTLRFVILLSGLIFVGLTIPFILKIQASAHYRERTVYARQQVESLKSRCPANVSVQKWDQGVEWTSNAITQIYFSPTHGDIESLENLCRFLDRKTQEKIGLNTLRSIWEEFAKVQGSGQNIAVNFRDVRLLTEEPITDDNLADLWSLDQCIYLDLSNTDVTDAGMKYLVEANVELLDLSSTQVGDQGIRELMQIKSLAGLHIGRTQITDDGVRYLLSKPALDSLSLSHTGITDEGLKSVGQLTHMNTLWLDGTHITDRGLESLTNLHQMTQLDLSGTGVTSEGVLLLKDLKALRMLILKDTGISKDEIARLKSVFRQCVVQH